MRFRGRARRPFRGRRYLATAASSIYLGTGMASTAALIPLIFDAIAQSLRAQTRQGARSTFYLLCFFFRSRMLIGVCFVRAPSRYQMACATFQGLSNAFRECGCVCVCGHVCVYVCAATFKDDVYNSGRVCFRKPARPRGRCWLSLTFARKRVNRNQAPRPTFC